MIELIISSLLPVVAITYFYFNENVCSPVNHSMNQNSMEILKPHTEKFPKQIHNVILLLKKEKKRIRSEVAITIVHHNWVHRTPVVSEWVSERERKRKASRDGWIHSKRLNFDE